MTDEEINLTHEALSFYLDNCYRMKNEFLAAAKNLDLPKPVADYYFKTAYSYDLKIKELYPLVRLFEFGHK